MKTNLKHISRRTISLILCVLMLFSTLMVGSISTANAAITGNIYFDNSKTNWSSVYCFLGHNGYLKSYKMTFDSDDIWKTETSFNNEWNDATAVYFASADGGVSGGTSSSNMNTSRSTLGLTNYTNKSTTVSAGTSNCYVPANGDTNANLSIMTVDDAKASHSTGSVSDDIISVLKGEKVMVYGGERTDWNQDTFYLMKSDSTSNYEAKGSMSGSYKFGDSTTTYEFAVLTAPVADYYMGHWASGLHTTIEAGGAYIVRGSTTNSELTQVGNSNSNCIYKADKGATTTATTTISSEIAVGEKLSVNTTSSKGISAIGETNSFKYYLYDGTNYQEVTLSNNEVDTSALPAGDNYKLLTVLYDGNIYVVADTDEFTIGSAPTSYTGLSVDKTGNGTVKISADNCPIENGSVDIEAIPATGYSFTKWTATNGTVGSETTAKTTLTPSANNAKATATFTENLYDVTVDNGDTTTTVKAGVDTHPSITAADKTGYKFTGWSTTGGATVADETVNGKTTTVSATAAGTVTANYEEITYARLYYSNPNNWTDVYAYVWYKDSSNKVTEKASWPGEKITAQKETINGVNYYYVEFDSSIGYDSIIFHANIDNNKTGDLGFSESDYGKYTQVSSSSVTDANWTALPTNKPLLDITNGTEDTNGSIEGFYSDSGYTTPITQAREGERVYVKVTANPGYKLKTLTAGSTDIKTNKYFDMPSSAVSVVAEFEMDLSTNYILNIDNNNFAFKKSSDAPADNICYAKNVTLTAGQTYTFYVKSSNSGSQYGHSGTMTYDNCTDWTFTTSPNTCKITASVTGAYEFKWDYTTDTKKLSVTYPSYTATISADPSEGGSVSAESITGPTDVTATPKSGYKFKEWVVTGNVSVANANSATTKITPTGDGGEVTATFVKVHKVDVTGASYDSTPADLSNVEVGTEVKITFSFGPGLNYNVSVKNLIDYDYKDGQFTFIMPDNDVTITATYTTIKHTVTIDAPNPIDSYVTDYSVTYTQDQTEKTETVQKGGKIQVDEGSTVTITANEYKINETDVVSVESWNINGIDDPTKNTKNLTISSVSADTTVYPTVYGKIKVASVTVDTTSENPTVTVVMGASADQARASETYKPVITVKKSDGTVFNTFNGDYVEATSIPEGVQYPFAPITIEGLTKGDYTVSAEIFGYFDNNNTQVAYGKSDTDTPFAFGYSYKESAYTGENDAWVDAVPSYNSPTGDTATLIKWNNYSGANKGTSKYNDVTLYTFYLPNSVEMSNLHIYHNLHKLVINNQEITSGGTYSFETNKEYVMKRTIKVGGTEETRYVKFMKGSASSTQLYLNTKNSDGTAYDLPMELHTQGSDENAQAFKETITCVGTEIAVDQKGDVTTGTLKKFKGRGNSSWKASCDLFGKYAFNMTLKDSANLFGLAGDNKNGNTKYSLLANNVDEAQVRNSYIYKLAKELGFEYFPNFQMADVYDNGVYMGSYLVCQKVELGKKGMITEPEIKYNDATDEAGNVVPFTTDTGTYDGCNYQYTTNRTDTTNYNSGGTYLMEFELPDRYQAELSWFISKKGQPIVVASPENASQAEMEFIIGKWNTVEAAVYGELKNGKKQTIDDVRDKIDVESFAKMYLIQELSKNLDACSTSYNVLYKSAEDKFYAEPVWDFDWTLGQYVNNPKSLVNAPSNADNYHANPEKFFARYKGMSGSSSTVRDFEAELCNNASFWADVQTIWENEFYTVATNENEYLENTYIPGIRNTILMNEDRWGFIASDPSTGWGSNDTGDTLDVVSKFTTKWITDRLTWLNNNITPTMYTVSAGEGATMTYMDNMGNGKLNAYTQFASGTRLTFTAANQPGKEFKGWSTDGTSVNNSIDKTQTLTVTVSGNATYTPIFEMTYKVETTPVTYYVDMHGDSDLKPTINFADSDTLTLEKVGSSTVYSGTYDTEYYVDESGNTVDIATKISTITAGGKDLALTSAHALNKKCLETGEVWIEATKSIKDAETSNTTTPAKGATTTTSTTKRIYWSNNYDVLGSPYAYYWLRNSDNSEKTYVTWDNSPAMTQLSTGSSIFYIDVPKEVNRVIFKGSKGKTVDITVTDTEYAFAPGDDQNKDGSGNYCAYKWNTMPVDPNPTSYVSSYELYVDDTTGTHSIAPTLSTGATAAYSVADSSIADVSATGVITPKAVGSTTVTITITGSSKDTTTLETTIKVINRPAAAAAYAIMSYQSNTSSFQAVGGTLGTITTTLAGSAYSGVTTGGIIDTENNTVKYAVADSTVTAYADLLVTVTVTPTANDNYKFVEWTKNNTTISGATQELTVKLNTVATDKYIVTFSLDSVQVVFTYNFVDYDTSSGYEYVVDGPTKAASYTTSPKYVHASAIKKDSEGIGYVVTPKLQEEAQTNMPKIVSNYFNYSLDASSVKAPTMVNGIYYVTATMTNTAREYTVSVDGVPVYRCHFQEQVALDATEYADDKTATDYVWKIYGQTTPISDKKVYTFRVAGDINLQVTASTANDKIKNLSVVNATYHEIKTKDNKNYVGQNFYIQNFYRQNDPVYDADGNVVEGATDKTFEGAGVLSYNITTSTKNPVNATVRNFLSGKDGDQLKDALINVAKEIGVESTDNSKSNSIHEASGLNYSFVKGSETVDDVTGQTFMKYSQTQGCYSYFYQALTEQSKLYRSQSYVVYSYYVYSYMLDGKKTTVYVLSDQYATAKVYEVE